ncbi:thioredoxin family protein [Kiritimatiellaeota bacterium B1221]|nr:thioredoxin family protein [Kiritimatiellaeota bacterium B1221]
MKKICIFALSLFTLLGLAQAAEAPAFTLTDTNGNEHSLSDFKGKVVVLEWFNHGCPFVKKHYSKGNMQALQKTYTDKGVVWLAIVSSAEGKQGSDTAEGHNKTAKEKGTNATAILMDTDGTVGKAYGAKTTPHMFVINAEGELVYQGAIDDKRSTNPADIATSKNYVSAALDAVLAGEAVEVTKSTPYGCSVKY